jgi:excinuclease UvrABC nuclease subunit
MTIIKRSGILPWNEENIQKAPDATGVYILRESDQKIENGYVGRTREPRRLRERLLEHWNSKDIPNVTYFDWYQTESEENARVLEDEWIKEYKPKHNTAQK